MSEPNPNGERRRNLSGRFGEPSKFARWACMDCGADTIDEYYVIHHDLWRAAVGGRAGKLCLPCLETRIGRRLNAADFLPCGANDLDWRKTDRLRERMTTEDGLDLVVGEPPDSLDE